MRVVFKPGAKERLISKLQEMTSVAETVGVKQSDLVSIINVLRKERIFEKTSVGSFVVVETTDIGKQRVKVEESSTIPWISTIEEEFKERILQL
jgi:hypothetical protein